MRLHIAITITLLQVLGFAVAAQTRSPEAQLKAAQHKAHVEGDLTGAIEQYKQLVARRDIARPLAAEALLGLAQSLEKLGAADARTVYERILRDYADQGTIVATARERMAILGAPVSRGLATRQLLQLPSRIALLSLMSDGRIGATDWSTGDLVLVDPATSAISHVVRGGFRNKPETWAESPLLSPDRRQLAYSWFGADPREQNGALCVLSLEKSAKPRTVLADPAATKNIFPVAWSKDQTSILVSYEMPVPAGSERAEGRGDFALAWVSVDRGVRRPIKTFEWWRNGVGAPNSIGRVSLSPDAEWIAYAVPDRQGAPERSIFVMRVDGTGERRVVTGGVNDQPVWSPDGSRLVFLSNRSGDQGLWSVAVNERGDNPPTVIKNGTGRMNLHGMLPSGVLVYSEAGLDPLVVADFDQPIGPKTKPSTRTVQTLNGLLPSWSPDGRHLAYKRRAINPARPVEMVVHTLETGEVRTYSPRTTGMGIGGQPSWYRDGTVQAIARSGVRLKVAGAVLDEVTVPATLRMGFVSPDGRTLYATQANSVEVFAVSSGDRTGTVALPKGWRPAALSPDGRYFALFSLEDSATAKLAIIGVDGSGFRLISSSLPGRVTGREPRAALGWSRDGSALFVAVTAGEDRSLIQRVPIDGGPAVTIVEIPNTLRAFDISPDDRRIAYSTDRPSTDVWMLDVKAALK